MNKFLKSFIGIFIIVIIIVLAVIQIIYINKTVYSIPTKIQYKIGDDFEYDGMLIKVSDYKIYRGEELNSKYNNELTGMVDEKDILFNLTITNISDTNKSYNASGSGIMYGYESGGNVNPFLFQYFNPNKKGIVTLAEGECETVTLAFPIDDNDENIEYIISLYPENIRVKIR